MTKETRELREEVRGLLSDMKRYRNSTLLVILVMFGVLALMLQAGFAYGHEWYTGQDNEQGQSCCGGNDCGVVSSGRIRQISGGYEVLISPGDMSTYYSAEPHWLTFMGNPGLSPDGDIHACKLSSQEYLRCLFIGGLM